MIIFFLSFQICANIENLKVDKYDRPLQEVKMLNIEVK